MKGKSINEAFLDVAFLILYRQLSFQRDICTNTDVTCRPLCCYFKYIFLKKEPREFVDIVTRMRTELSGVGIPIGARDFSVSKIFQICLGTSLLFSGYLRLKRQGVMFSTRLRLALRLKVSTCSFHLYIQCIPSCRGQAPFCFHPYLFLEVTQYRNLHGHVQAYEGVSKSPSTILITRESLVIHEFPARVCCGGVL